MKALGIIIAAFLAVGLVVAGCLLLGYFSFTSRANQQENGIEAQYTQNQNVFDNGWKKVTEIAQVPEKQAADLKNLYKEVAEGLKSPSQLVLALGKFNPNMDQSTYKQLQQTIEIYHNEFQQNQTELIARKNEYKNLLTVNFSGRLFNMVAGYPHIDLSRYDIVTSERTENVFKTKKADALNVFGDKP